MDETVIIRNSKGALTFAFLAGATIGVYVGGALVRRAMREQMSEQIEEEFERLRAKYAGVKPWSSPKEAVEELHPEMTLAEKVKGFQEPPKRAHVAYEKIREFQPNDEAPEETEEELEAPVVETAPESEDIYVITSEVFVADEKGHIQESLSYYPLDNTVTDPRDNKVYQHQKFIGDKFHTYFGSGDDPNTVCVRNDKLQIDYEISLVPNGSFERDVAGIAAEEPAELTDRQRINGV